MEKNLSAWWNEFKETISEYLQARLDLTRAQAYERIARVTGIFFSFLVLFLMTGFVLMFTLLMIGFWLSALLNSFAFGFTIVGVLVIAFFLVIYFGRKHLLEEPVSNRIIHALYAEHDHEPEKENK